MRVAVTGTPGTGKTSATEAVETDLAVIHLNDVIREEGLSTGTDPDRGSLYADMDALGEWLAGKDDILVESHLAHRFPVDRVVVLRCHPEELERRLRERGETEAKATENAEAEALDVILSEAVHEHGLDSVHEVDTTNRTPAEVAEEIEAVIAGDREPSAGEVDFVGWL
ncbi:adenylate kinase family protein [Natronomonas sp. EA1]|uniref:adenylate kinase family protein n=1 Tax=Natronomonas sp. EA1 TaxID=3421655 RepID=UPI003EB7DCE4